MASNKYYRMGYNQSAASRLSLKIERNAPCPCGNSTEKIFTDEAGVEHKIPVPVKYKKCCMGKQFFFKSKEDAEAAKRLDGYKEEGTNQEKI